MHFAAKLLGTPVVALISSIMCLQQSTNFKRARSCEKLSRPIWHHQTELKTAYWPPSILRHIRGSLTDCICAE